MKTTMRRIAVVLSGAVFVVSALLKLHSIASFELYLYGFGFLSFDLSSLAARLLIAGELVLGAGLAVGFRPRLLCRIGLGVTLLFSLWLVWLVVAGREDNCHCFGDMLRMNPVQSLVKNGVLAAGFLWGGTGSDARNGARKYPSCMPPVAAALLVVGVFLLAPEPAAFRSHRSGSIGEECAAFLAERLPEGRRLAVFYGTECPYCRMAAAKIAAICRRHRIPPERLHAFFLRSRQRMEEPVSVFFAEAGARPHPWSEVEVLDFIRLTEGKFPLLVFTDNGRVAAVCRYDTLDEGYAERFFGR